MQYEERVPAHGSQKECCAMLIGGSFKPSFGIGRIFGSVEAFWVAFPSDRMNSVETKSKIFEI
jgi:hypothetical protein